MIKKRKYIKKVIPILNSKSSPQERAERLRRIRGMANLTREEMCEFLNELGKDEFGLNVNTYKGWEIARYGGLPADGAVKVCSRVAKENVVCDPMWLLHGAGMGPYVIPDYQKTEFEKSNLSYVNDIKKEYIWKEIALFKEFFIGGEAYEMIDDGLSPIYEQGDIIAGIPCYREKIETLLGKACIVKTQEGLILARILQSSETKGRYNLICSNVNTTVKKPVLYEVGIDSAAPIIRHYKKDS